VILRIKALQSLRWNYKRRGVWIWLKGRAVRCCIPCLGDGKLCKNPPLHVPTGGCETSVCPTCHGTGEKFGKRGYQRILSEPQNVLNEQTAAVKGVFV
jgi:hypothetical protein